MPGLNARTGWDFEETRRTFTEVARTREHTVRLDLRANRDRFSFNGGLAWLERRGSEYRYNLPYLASYSSEAFINALASASGCAILAECIRVGPLQNKFYIADRDRLRARAWTGYNEAPFSASLRLDLNRDRYPNSPYGLGESNQSVASLDAGFTPDETFSASAFVTFDRQSQASRTRQIGSVNAVSSNPLADWRVDQGNRTRTLGLNATRAALAGGRLTLSVEALWLSSRSPVTLAAGPAVNPAQNPPGALPDLLSVSTRLALEARYALSRATLLKARYQAWRQRNDDWSLEQVRAATLSNVIGTLETPLYGTTHGLGLSVVHTFR
ncbi:MAG TPA: MtrB/PioB family outer membrane beta-barrel protein, partial [Usitatibacteraceae bacterium]|nr:MtrB/PioB family outer membrane beta-barrel protein [Usitatibacteraceae bacterium]